MSWGDELNAFGDETEQDVKDIFAVAGQEFERSILSGSELTGAKGQPIRKHALIESWIKEQTPTAFEMSTKQQHAIYIEDGGNDRGPFNPERQDGKNGRRSAVGGYHNVALTMAAADRVFADAQTRVLGA